MAQTRLTANIASPIHYFLEDRQAAMKSVTEWRPLDCFMVSMMPGITNSLSNGSKLQTFGKVKLWCLQQLPNNNCQKTPLFWCCMSKSGKLKYFPFHVVILDNLCALGVSVTCPTGIHVFNVTKVLSIVACKIRWPLKKMDSLPTATAPGIFQAPSCCICSKQQAIVWRILCIYSEIMRDLQQAGLHA